jgi:hypothetical protein
VEASKYLLRDEGCTKDAEDDKQDRAESGSRNPLAHPDAQAHAREGACERQPAVDACQAFHEAPQPRDIPRATVQIVKESPNAWTIFSFWKSSICRNMTIGTMKTPVAAVSAPVMQPTTKAVASNAPRRSCSLAVGRISP